MPLRIGTDCSGIEAPLEALQQMGIPYDHVFASEIDPHAIKFIQERHKPRILYRDMTKRDPRKMPFCDLYVCGFPCQPYSGMNAHRDRNDPRMRPLYAVLDYIKTKSPKLVILENVKRFASHPLMQTILKTLKRQGYTVDYQILTPLDYGCPQSRQRVFIVASALKSKINWPAPKPLKNTLLSFLRYEKNPVELTDCYKNFLKIWQIPSGMKGIIEMNSASRNFCPYVRNGIKPSPVPRDKLHKVVKKDVAPCLVAHAPGLYVNHLKRMLSRREMLELQGFRSSVQFPKSLSLQQCNKLVGNSMNVAVLKALFSKLLQ